MKLIRLSSCLLVIVVLAFWLDDPSHGAEANAADNGQNVVGRQIENFTDLGHFPWVHPGLLGDPSRVVVVPPEVRTVGHVLH